MKRNVEINGLGATEEEITTPDGQQTLKVHGDDAWYVQFLIRSPGRLTRCQFSDI